MRRRFSPFGAAILVWLSPASLGAPGLSVGQSRQADPLAAAVQPFVDRRSLAGAVMLVANRERTLELAAVGFADMAAHKRMQNAPHSRVKDRKNVRRRRKERLQSIL